MTPDLPSTNTKKWVWIPHPTLSYIPAYIESTNNVKNTVTAVTQDNQKVTISAHSIYKMNPEKFKMTEDLALLSYLNEPSVLHNLKQRYDHDLIYTYSGLFLLAINPYKEIRNLYSDRAIEKYHTDKIITRNYNVMNAENKPHIYAVANDAYNSMLLNHQNQSVLITGESGAGKTENTKKVINFLAHIAHDRKDNNSYSTNIADKIIETNIILEAFGNAQTIKNDNSSRFGKFIKIEFTKGLITGAHIEKYLLEKSRITRVNKNERNYHIFYQLILGLNNKKINDKIYNAFIEELKQKTLLKDNITVHNFEYLKNTNKKINNVDDEQEFYRLNKSMDILEFTEEEKISIFKIISTILHLGNLKFKEKNDQAEIVNQEEAEKVCELLNIPLNNFLNTLLTPTIKAGNERVVNSRNKEQVINIVEALARLLYERMFETIIDKLNSVLAADSYSKSTSSSFIGVLDIAGFEIFEKNDFEQLCINFTNEKLQQFFNTNMFVLEQEIYKKENIDWKFIDFGLDLQPTIDLIEKITQ